MDWNAQWPIVLLALKFLWFAIVFSIFAKVVFEARKWLDRKIENFFGNKRGTYKPYKKSRWKR